MKGEGRGRRGGKYDDDDEERTEKEDIKKINERVEDERRKCRDL